MGLRCNWTCSDLERRVSDSSKAAFQPDAHLRGKISRLILEAVARDIPVERTEPSMFPRRFATGAPEGFVRQTSSRGFATAIDAFKDTMPLFVPERFFVGRVEGWAVLESLAGGLLKRATITGHGEFESDTGTVLFTEAYTFDDGHSDTLHWTIRKGDGGKYTGLETDLKAKRSASEPVVRSIGSTRTTRRKLAESPSS